MAFQPILHVRTAEAVVERIQNLILEGALRPGDRLPAERQLAQNLNVSRPILRDALAKLEADGLIAARAGEGTFVIDLAGEVFTPPIANLLKKSERGMADFMEFRRHMEGNMAALAAQRASDADRDMLRALGKAMVQAHDRKDAKEEARLDVELHTLIVEAAHNIVYLHMMRACYALLSDGVSNARQRLYAQPNARKVLLDQHLWLIKAVVDGKAEEARRRAQEHIDHVSVASDDLVAAEAREEASRIRQSIRLANDTNKS